MENGSSTRSSYGHFLEAPTQVDLLTWGSAQCFPLVCLGPLATAPGGGVGGAAPEHPTTGLAPVLRDSHPGGWLRPAWGPQSQPTRRDTAFINQTKANTTLGTLSIKPLVEGATVRSPEAGSPGPWGQGQHHRSQAGWDAGRVWGQEPPHPPTRPLSGALQWHREPRQRPCSVSPHPPEHEEKSRRRRQSVFY